MPHLTKPGAHGTLKRYLIRYGDDPTIDPTQEWGCWAYSAEHAIEKFDADDEGYTPFAWALLVVSDDGLTRRDHEMRWHNLIRV